ncbi:hypothetical protein HZC27_01005 [Candidatus Roizmanbacteria bacterium]|nr:hypothetical protein [Candidatus Roizmanbacteria bacterium]
MEQDKYYREFAEVAPITVLNPHEGVVENLEIFNARGGNIMIIANHPPYEKTISPTREQVEESLRALGRGDLIEGMEDHFPAVIARRAVIAKTLNQVFPELDYQFHVVGAEFYNQPMSTIQQQDETIIVPYTQTSHQGDGYLELYRGMRIAFDPSRVHPKHIVVAFPEGRSSRDGIEKLSRFHSGPFGVAQTYAIRHNVPVTVLPIVMGVRSDFSTVSKMLPPFQLNPANLVETVLFSKTQAEMMQLEYTRLLYKMGSYYWQGMAYPYGGPSKETITHDS